MKPFLNHKTYFTKEEYLKNVQFPYTLHLLGAGTGAAYFWLPIYFGSGSMGPKYMRLLAAPAPQPC